VRIRREARWLGPIAALVLVAIACAIYLLSNERLASPFSSSYTVYARFENVDAVAPGLGEPVNVAGVRVGQISGVSLKDGVGVLELLIDPDKLPHLYEGATAALVPNTPLKDMQVDLAPGRPGTKALPHGATIPIERTGTPVDADSLLGALDADTRSYLQLLITDSGAGLRSRAPQLRQLLRTLGPTSAQLQRVGDLLVSRRHEVRLLVHNLALLTKAMGSHDAQVARVVAAGNVTLQALASQDGALRSSVQQLPETLAVAHRTLVDARPLARNLRSTLVALEPAAPRLRTTLQSTPDALRGLLPLPLEPLRRYVAAVGPIGPKVKSASRDLGAATPPLTKAFRVIAQTTNILAYDDGGGHGYLFWIDWFAHNADSMLSSGDAHGGVWRGLALFSCSSLSQVSVSTCP
jgi:phospholipid/cholesterol/gamma-HCH transport system substrate-binding protein